MARTVGPLMSFEASGSIAKTLTFSRWKGRPYVRSLVTPSNPKSPLQISTRAIMRFLSQVWGFDVSGPDQATWEDLAQASSISPFNAFTRANLKAWTQFLPPASANPIGRTGTPATWTTLPGATGGVRQITFDWDVNVKNDDWGLLMFLGLGGPVTPGRDTLAYAANISAAPGTAVITGLAPDTYYFESRSFTEDGLMSADLQAGNVTVT